MYIRNFGVIKERFSGERHQVASNSEEVELRGWYETTKQVSTFFKSYFFTNIFNN